MGFYCLTMHSFTVCNLRQLPDLQNNVYGWQLLDVGGLNVDFIFCLLSQAEKFMEGL